MLRPQAEVSLLFYFTRFSGKGLFEFKTMETTIENPQKFENSQQRLFSDPVQYVGFWVRLGADILDSLMISAASWFLEMVFLGAIHWARILFLSAENRATLPGFSDAFSPLTLQIVNLVLYSLIAFPYTVYSHYFWGATPAKRLLGFQVVDFDSMGPMSLKQSVIRCLSLMVSYLPLAAGYLMVALHPQKRALHDLIAGTVSIYRKGRYRTNPMV